MEAYRPYVLELESALNEVAASSVHSEQVWSSLQGARAKAELRRLVSIEELRNSGAFFTGKSLASEALKYLVHTLDDESVILDPACGAGDLLLACADRNSECATIRDTLRQWAENYIGRDLHKSFIDVARIRLLLSMISLRGLSGKVDEGLIAKFKPNMHARSIFEDLGVIKQATHIVMNPPYTMVPAPGDCVWSSGKVNAAAVFFDLILRFSNPGTRVVAILPEVLRSGSRYGKWRGLVNSYCRVERIRRWGRFDKNTDVHVFILDCVVKDPTPVSEIFSADWVSAPSSNVSLGELFDVSIGPVVHYRDPKRGPWLPYLVAKGLPVWKAIRNISKNRRYSGRTIKPPFVVVRRTSRPEDSSRALATIVGGKRPVAVDNHLIVLVPKDGTLRSCNELLGVLQDSRTSEWLNQRIRCRHLTVTALRDLPWWD